MVHLARQHCSAGVSGRAWAMWLTSSLLIGALALHRQDPVFIALQASSLTSAAVIVLLTHRYRGMVCETHAHLRATDPRRRSRAGSSKRRGSCPNHSRSSVLGASSFSHSSSLARSREIPPATADRPGRDSRLRRSRARTPASDGRPYSPCFPGIRRGALGGDAGRHQGARISRPLRTGRLMNRIVTKWPDVSQTDVERVAH